jgi:hypothetical protein
MVKAATSSAAGLSSSCLRERPVSKKVVGIRRIARSMLGQTVVWIQMRQALLTAFFVL